jgi:hypothetical protein
VVTLPFFPWCKPKSSRGRLQRPITSLRRPWDDFMVHSVNRPWEPATITFQALSLVEKAEPVQICSTLRLQGQWSMWMQDGCKVYMDFYMASNGSCFVFTWTVFKNHLLEVGLTKRRRSWHSERSQLLIYYILSCVRTRMNRDLLKGPRHIWLHTTLEGPWPHYIILEVCWDGLWTLSFDLVNNGSFWW